MFLDMARTQNHSNLNSLLYIYYTLLFLFRCPLSVFPKALRTVDTSGKLSCRDYTTLEVILLPRSVFYFILFVAIKPIPVLAYRCIMIS